MVRNWIASLTPLLLLFCALGPAHAADPPRMEAHGGATTVGAPIAIVVHGINPTAGSLDPLARTLARRGYRVFQFHYDDGQSLEVSGNQLAVATKQLVALHTPAKLVIVAHSMGGLVARRTLTTQHPVGLGRLKPTLITVASPFGGFKSANWATWDFGIGPDSHDDLGTNAEFITKPGRLHKGVKHYKLETRESGQTVVNAKGKVVDDEILSLANQRQVTVDRDAHRRQTLLTGHVEAVNSGGEVSTPLMIWLNLILGPEKPSPKRKTSDQGLAPPAKLGDASQELETPRQRTGAAQALGQLGG